MSASTSRRWLVCAKMRYVALAVALLLVRSHLVVCDTACNSVTKGDGETDDDGL